MLRAGETMRLKGHQQTARAQLPEGLERGADFIGVMAVIIEDADERTGKKFLLPPGRATKRSDGRRDFFRRETELMKERDDSSAVAEIFFTDQGGGEVAEFLARVPDFKCARGFGLDAIGGERMEAVRDRAGPRREKFGEPRIVGAEDEMAGGLRGEVRELAADGVEVRVKIEMLLIHVEHDGVFRRKLAQRAVALVGLDDEVRNESFLRRKKERGRLVRPVAQMAALQSGVPRQLRHECADGVARLCAELFQREGEQRAGRGLAVHPRDTDAVLTLQQRSQKHGAAHHRNFHFQRRAQFGVVRADGRGINDEHRWRGLDLTCGVTGKNFRTARL